MEIDHLELAYDLDTSDIRKIEEQEEQELDEMYREDYGKLLDENPKQIIKQKRLIRTEIRRIENIIPMIFETPIRPLYWAINVESLPEAVAIF